jgi:hypothetical protein
MSIICTDPLSIIIEGPVKDPKCYEKTYFHGHLCWKLADSFISAITQDFVYVQEHPDGLAVYFEKFPHFVMIRMQFDL